MSNIRILLDKFCAVLSYCGTVLVFFLMFLIVADVVGRVGFNHPVTGTPEIVKNAISVIAFFMMAWAAYEDRHVRSTMLLDRMPPLGQKILNIIAHLTGVLLFIGIIISSWKPTILAIKILEFEGEGALRVPTYPVRIIIIIGSALTAYQCLVKLIETIISFRQPAVKMKGDVDL